ncbi:bifunctional DNA primase/polymerase [Bacillus sp. H-16]|uniref:bifunctional DNA primase/polymerase n=1 Tax=Alteribacter salitolerans TaxID=2912333 RepID=UPI00196497DD|nr:bifunctional DNA primase/polymerase [Alteribacter salitolerans]MBM7096657.1 bifunctional DNA primase/polymerase [Alteribacter salitolerans]
MVDYGSLDTVSCFPAENIALQAALGYTQLLKWAVFPVHSIEKGRCTCNKACTSPGKHPRTLNGVKAATAQTDKIIKMFSGVSQSNVGIATGSKSGFFVLDIDPKHGGDKSLKVLTDQYGKIPQTVKAQTGGCGYHYLFQHQNGIFNRTSIMPGIDIRGEGGYIVAPPSRHSSGKKYKWEVMGKPRQIPIAKAPSWLLELIVQTKGKRIQKKPSSYWSDLLNGVCEGERNIAAASLSGYLFRKIDPVLVPEIMRLWNEARVNPPLKRVELERVLNSVARLEYKRRQKEGREWTM